MIIVVAAIVVVAGLAGVALLASGGDDGTTDTTGAPVPTYSAEAEQNRPVEVAGDPLAQYDLAAETDVAVGVAAPVITGEDFDGETVTLGGATDGPTLLVFLAHWCPHCNAEIPEILELNNDGGIPADVDVIGISTAVDESAPNFPPSEWVADKGWLWPVLADDVNATAFVYNGGRGFPFMMLLDADGTVVSRISGEHTADELGEWLDASLSTSA